MSWSDIPGWFDFASIYTRAVETAPKGANLVEVGVAFGRSVAFLASEAIRLKRDDLRIVAIDPWVDDWTTPEGWAEEARPTWGAEHAEWARSVGGPFCAFVTMMLKHAPAELERIQVVRGKSCEVGNAVAVPYCPECPPYEATPGCWLVFIDGDHRYEAVKEDIEWWSGEVMSGGILAGHDYTTDFPGVLRAVHETLGKENVTVEGTSWVRK